MWRMPVDLNASKRDADLVAYYDNEVRSRAQRRLPPQRVAHRAGFIELVKGEVEARSWRSDRDLGETARPSRMRASPTPASTCHLAQ
jgi:hypothetical protein